MKERIKHIEGLEEANLPKEEFLIVHSAWFALIGLRRNGDLDLIISSKLRQKRFSDKDPNKTFGLPGTCEKRIRIQPVQSLYGTMFGAQNIDDVIYNHFIELDGFRFVEPRFYFEYKRQRLKTLEAKLQSILPWKRWLFQDYHVKKLVKKINKDKKDFRYLHRFYKKEGHRIPELQSVSDTAWGIKQ